jgi:heme/copper-type cytochrome/quinol oxidase subunit 2
MRYLPPFLLAVAAACFAFAYWGLATPAGRRAYDEMDGIIPAAAGLAGVVLGVAAAAIWLWRRLRAARR